MKSALCIASSRGHFSLCIRIFFSLICCYRNHQLGSVRSQILFLTIRWPPGPSSVCFLKLNLAQVFFPGDRTPKLAFLCVPRWLLRTLPLTRPPSSSILQIRWRRCFGCTTSGLPWAAVPVSPCSWSVHSQMLSSPTTLCPPTASSRRMVPREEDDKRLCLLLLTDLDDLTPAPHCSNRRTRCWLNGRGGWLRIGPYVFVLGKYGRTVRLRMQ